MKPITLKPCPFCGGTVNLENPRGRPGWWGVVCRNTSNLGGSCALEIRPQASQEAAAERWNMRAPEDRLRAVLADAREFVEMSSPMWYGSGQRLLKKIDEALK
jgi:hypothetical protein